MKKIIIANWKCNPPSLEEAVLLARKIEKKAAAARNIKVVIAPPFSFLRDVGHILKKAKLGAQDVFWAAGPYTGEVSAPQLKGLGVQYVIIGHSERRINLGETDEMVNKKIKAALGAGLIPILCVGEREKNDEKVFAIVGEQMEKAFAGIKKNLAEKIIIVYEPVWAISTIPGAEADTPDSVFSASVYIRKFISKLYGRTVSGKIMVIYGGSVKAGNVSLFLDNGKMQGVLVGGASLNPIEFEKIISA